MVLVWPLPANEVALFNGTCGDGEEEVQLEIGLILAWSRKGIGKWATSGGNSEHLSSRPENGRSISMGGKC